MISTDEISKVAIEAGACPIGYVDQSCSERWSVDEICGWFSCAECVATPRDFGHDMDEWPDPDDLPEESPYMRWLGARDGEECLEVPF